MFRGVGECEVVRDDKMCPRDARRVCELVVAYVVAPKIGPRVIVTIIKA